MRRLDTTDWAVLDKAYQALAEAPLTLETVDDWLAHWSDLEAQIQEDSGNAASRSHENTADTEAEARYLHYVREILPNMQIAHDRLVGRLLALEGYEPPSEYRQMLHEFRVGQRLFREENVALQRDVSVLITEYRKLTGRMGIEWEGETLNLDQAEVILDEPGRERREAVWRAMHSRFLQDREPINQIYLDMLALRRRIARNADLENHRDYAWLERGRHDYTPKDAFTFHQAIEQEVVPVAQRLYEERRTVLGLETLRPWDLAVVTDAHPPLRPFETVGELAEGCERIFQAIDPVLGEQFNLLRANNLLELDSRANKAPGGYCRVLPVSERSYIYMHAVGQHQDVQTLLHEGGHAFHNQHAMHLPLIWMRHAPMEMAEVASMGMELLAHPFLERAHGGFYEEEEANRARIQHLEKIVLFLPYMAVVDAFQHWVYVEAPEEVTAQALDEKWGELWDRFMVGIDYSGLEAEKVTGWHRKRHIFIYPFYYIEYGLAQVGALQLWRNAMAAQAPTLAAYRHALALGGSRPLPDLYESAGIRFAFDAPTLRSLMALIEQRRQELATVG